MEDTIAAISTAQGIGAISIVRVSGSDAIKIVNDIFSKDIMNALSHTIHYGFIVDNAEKVDEVLVSVMSAPRTFTVEDVLRLMLMVELVLLIRYLNFFFCMDVD